MILWVAPAVAALGLAVMVRVSARARTSQEANQLGGAVILPLIFLAVGQSTGPAPRPPRRRHRHRRGRSGSSRSSSSEAAPSASPATSWRRRCRSSPSQFRTMCSEVAIDMRPHQFVPSAVNDVNHDIGDERRPLSGQLRLERSASTGDHRRSRNGDRAELVIGDHDGSRQHEGRGSSARAGPASSAGDLRAADESRVIVSRLGPGTIEPAQFGWPHSMYRPRRNGDSPPASMRVIDVAALRSPRTARFSAR